MFGFNSRMLIQLRSFAEFNSLRKNQLLTFYRKIKPILTSFGHLERSTTKFRDYYFMPQYEVGQPELVDLHHYTYDIDICSILYKSNLLGKGAGGDHRTLCQAGLFFVESLYHWLI